MTNELNKSILKANILSKYYISEPLFKPKSIVKALDGVSLELNEKETVALLVSLVVENQLSQKHSLD